MANYTLSAKLTADITEFQKGLQQAQSSLSSLSKSATNAGTMCTSVGKALTPVTTALTGVAATAFNTCKNFIQLYESSIVVFEKMLDGSDAAQQLYSDLLGIAKASTFSQETFLEAGKSLVGVGVSAENTKKYLQATTDAVTAFGGSADDLQRVTYAFRKIATNGKFSMEEVNSMADVGVNVLAILGNQYGKNTDEMRDMISKGLIPAEEGLDKLTTGIEKGTDGVNGMTQALEGMSAALKGKTLTGALDSMNSSIRSFSLGLMQMNPTLTEADEGYEENQKRLNQLTAALTTINSIIPKAVGLFGSVTDAVGKLLDKLVGGEVVWDDQTNSWKRVLTYTEEGEKVLGDIGGVLGKVNNYLDKLDPDKMQIFSDAIGSLALAAPVLVGVGTGLKVFGKVSGALSGKLASATSGLSSLKNVISSTKGSQGLSNIAGGFKTIFSTIQTAMSQIASVVWKGITKISSLVWKGVSTIASLVWKGVSKLASLVWKGVTKLASLAWKGITKIASLAWKGISTIASYAWKGITQLATLIGKGINLIVTPFKIVGSKIISALNSMWSQIAPVVAKGVDFIVTPFKIVGSRIVGVLNTAWGKVTPVLNKGVSAVQTFGGKLVNAFKLIIGKVSSIIGKIISVIGAIGGKIVSILGTIWSTVAPIITNGINIILTPFKWLGSKIVALFGVIKTTVLPALNTFFGGLFSGLSSGLSQIFSGVMAFAPQITSAFLGLFKFALIGGAIVAVFGIIQQKFGESLDRLWPMIQAKGTELLSKASEWITNSLPEVINSGFTLIGNIIDTLTALMPQLIQVGMSLVANLISGFAQNLPTILPKVVLLITTIVQGLVENIGLLIDAGLQLLVGLANGIVAALPVLIKQLPTIIVTIVEALIEHLPEIITAGIQILVALGEGLIEALPQLITSITTDLIPAIWNIITETDWLGLGKQIIEGILEGFGSLGTKIGEKVGEVKDNVVGWFKEKFGIQSPSKLMHDEVGVQVGMGTVGGISDIDTAETDTQAQKVCDMVSDTFDRKMPGLISNVQGLFKGLFSSISGSGEGQSVGFNFDMSGLVESAETAMAQLNDVITSGYTQIRANLANQNSMVASETKTIFDSMVSQAVGSIQTMVDQVKVAVAGMNGAFNGVFDGLTKAALTQITTLFSGAQTIFNNLATTTQNIISKMGNAVVALFQSMITITVNASYSMANQIIAAVSLMTKGVISATTAFQASYIGIWNSAKNQAVSVVNTMRVLVVSSISTMVTQINRAVAGLPSDFNSIGRQMMSQLKAGIDSGKSAVLTVTSSLVSQLVSTFITGLGIHSPSKVMTWIGQMMLAGLIKGLSQKQIVEFTSKYVGEMQESFKNGELKLGTTVSTLKESGSQKLIDYLGKNGDVEYEGTSNSTVYPLSGGPYDITSWFGYRPASDTNGVGTTNHGGLDIGAPAGTPILAASGGTVSLAGSNGGYGNCVVIDHGNGLQTLYGHMSSIGTSAGATVTPGQVIGYVGSTGNSTGPHLHYEMRQNGTKIDPYPYIEGAQISGGTLTLSQAIQNALQLMKSGTSAEDINKMGSNVMIGGLNLGAYTGTDGDLTNWLTQACNITGEPLSSLPGLIYAAKMESGGNPNAINLWDSNAAAGNPSKGLLQTIQTTFDAYAAPGMTNVWNPVHNAVAAIRYMRARYGSVASVVNPRLGGWYGYAIGTNHARSGLAIVGENGPEVVNFAGGEKVMKNRDVRNSGLLGGVVSGVKSDLKEIGREIAKQITTNVKGQDINLNTMVNLDGKKVGYGTAKFVSEKNDFEESRMNRIRGIRNGV